MEKGTFISSVFGGPVEEYYLGKNVWSAVAADWKQRFEVGDAIIDPAGDCDPSSAETYIDSQIAAMTNDLAAEMLTRQQGDANLQSQVTDIKKHKIYLTGTTLTQNMINQQNTIYVVKDNLILDSDITVPASCILEFDGGSISNSSSNSYYISGTNTKISAPIVKIFGTNTVISGSWDIKTIYASWFNNQDNILRQVINLSSDDLYNEIIVTENYNFDLAETDPDYTPLYPQDTNQGDRGIKLKSNTTLQLDGNLTITANKWPCYHIINITNKKNVTIKGSGTIIGDKHTHDYTYSPAWLGGQEWGDGVVIMNSSNVYIKGIEVKETIGEGIMFANNNGLTIDSCNIHHVRKNCISGLSSNLIIKDCELHHIGGDELDKSPKSAIDLEGESDVDALNNNNINVIGNNIHDIVNGVLMIPNDRNFQNIFIYKNLITATELGVRVAPRQNGTTFTNQIVINSNTIDTSQGEGAGTSFDISGVNGLYILQNNIQQKYAKFKSCDNCIIKNNIILSTSGFDIVKGNYSFIGNNIKCSANNKQFLLNSSWALNVTISDYKVSFVNNEITNLFITDDSGNIQRIELINNLWDLGDEQRLGAIVNVSALISGNRFISNDDSSTINYFIDFTNNDNQIIFVDNLYKNTNDSNNQVIGLFNTNNIDKVYSNNNVIVLHTGSSRLYDKEIPIRKPLIPKIGSVIYSYNIYNRLAVYNGTYWIEPDGAKEGVNRSGTFAEKPSDSDIYVGFKYFCTDKQTAEGATNGIEIIHKGNNVWVDALGRVVS